MFSGVARTSFKRVPSRVSNVGKAAIARNAPARRHYSDTATVANNNEASSTSSTLRSKPWSFNQNTSFQKSQYNTQVGHLNQDMSAAFQARNPFRVIALARRMKEEGITPTLETYHILLSTLAYSGTTVDCFAVLEDLLSLGLEPNITTYNIILTNLFSSRQIWYIMDEMAQRNIQPNNETYQHLINFVLSDNALEVALQYLESMKKEGIEPTLSTIETLVIKAAELAQPRLAFDLATSFEADSIRMLGSEAWLACLSSSADVLWTEGVEKCWDKVVHKLGIIPDEGTCLAILNTAGRNSLPELAASVIETLRSNEVALQAHHFAPLIQALCQQNRLEDAFRFLTFMRTQGVDASAKSITHVIAAVLSKDVDALDSVWESLDALHAANEAVDVAALNGVLSAAVGLGDLQRAMGAYKSFADYKIVPTRDSFHILMQGSINAAHRELGNVLLKDMKESGVEPDAKTYEQMIDLCLTQDTYEDAFFYLEEMKAAGLVPSARVYEGIIDKCVMHFDVRCNIAMHEMEECGYTVKRLTRKQVEQLVQQDAESRERSAPRTLQDSSE